MNQIITNEILRAFELYKEANDISSNYVMCRALDIPTATYSNWKLGRSKTIKHGLWKKLEPILSEHILEACESSSSKSRIKVETKIETVTSREMELAEKSLSYFSNILEISSERYDEIQGLKKNLELLKNQLSIVSGDIPIPKKASRLPTPPPDLALVKSPKPHLAYDILAAGHSGILERDYDFNYRVEEFKHTDDIQVFTVMGESMDPTLKNNSLVVARPLIQPIKLGAQSDFHVPMNAVRGEVPDNSLAIISLDGEGVTVKRIRYYQRPGSIDGWGLYIHCDNKDWGDENGFPRKTGRLLRKTDEMWLYGLVVGRVER